MVVLIMRKEWKPWMLEEVSKLHENRLAVDELACGIANE